MVRLLTWILATALCLAPAGCGSKDSHTDTLLRRAEQGDADAQYSLAIRYYRGEGTEVDYVQAYKWFEVAEKGGLKGDAVHMAARARTEVATHMTPAQVTEAQRLAQHWMDEHPKKE